MSNQVGGNYGAWGDTGRGTYRNPILFADYSDPDAIRVGDDYYMICSEFNYMGMPVLKSRDLVNWTLCGRVYDSLPFPEFDADQMKRYGRGCWAPSIRHHNGRFYIYFCMPEEGLFQATAEKAEGPWTLRHVKKIAGWEDPCPLWTDEGAFLVHSVLGGGKLIVHRMSEDGLTLLDDGVVVYEGEDSEGPKFTEHSGEYLLFSPEGHTPYGWQVVCRAKSPLGPYESRIVCEQGDTLMNGPHQGALVDTPDGEWWFLHFSSTGVIGRVVCLEPVTFVDGWPVIGKPSRKDPLCGRPVTEWKKPNLPPCPVSCPATSDDFSSPELGLQWQWNHNPVADGWSLTARPGCFSLWGKDAGADLLHLPNILTQRLTGPTGLIRVTLDPTHMAVGQRAGLTLFGDVPEVLGLLREEDGVRVIIGRDGGFGAPAKDELTGLLPVAPVTLQITYKCVTEVHFAWWREGMDRFRTLHEDGHLHEGEWKGCRIGLWCAAGDKPGRADFSAFRYRHDGPCGDGDFDD